MDESGVDSLASGDRPTLVGSDAAGGWADIDTRAGGIFRDGLEAGLAEVVQHLDKRCLGDGHGGGDEAQRKTCGGRGLDGLSEECGVVATQVGDGRTTAEGAVPPCYISDEVGDGLWDVAKDVFFKELLQVRTRASGVQSPAY